MGLDYSSVAMVLETKPWPTARNIDETHETKQNHINILDCGTTPTVRYKLRETRGVCDAMNICVGVRRHQVSGANFWAWQQINSCP